MERMFVSTREKDGPAEKDKINPSDPARQPDPKRKREEDANRIEEPPKQDDSKIDEPQPDQLQV